MPLARLSIKSAIKVAQASVSLHQRSGTDAWIVRKRYERRVIEAGPYPRLIAKQVRRRERICLALLALDIGYEAAVHLSSKVEDDARDWRKVVAVLFEQYNLCGDKS